MTSRLSSLLVRDGLVTVKRMERAFQRQVLDGGALDTVLLELGMVPEARLIQYLALATGLPPVTHDDLAGIDTAAAARCPRELAELHGIVPLALDGDALRVLTRDPVDLAGLEALADELDQPVQPLVGPEVRWRVAFHRAFGTPLAERFARLLAQLDATSTPAPVGKPRSVVIEAAPEPAAPEEIRITAEFDAAALAAAVASAPPKATLLGVPVAAVRAAVSAHTPAAVAAGTPHATPEVVAPEPVVDEPTPPLRPETAPPALATETVEITARPPTEPAAPPAIDVSPLSVADARARLGEASRRDDVFDLLLRAVRKRVSYAALLTVQGKAAIGRIAIDGDRSDEDSIATVLVPLDAPSAFRKAVEDGAPYIGRIATGDEAIDAMLRRMGGVVPPAALILPIALRGRVVALVVGHRGAEPLGIAEVSEVLPLAAVAADAIGRILKKQKDAIKAEAAAARELDEGDTGPMQRRPVLPPTLPMAPIGAPGGQAPPAGVAGLIAAIERGDPAEREAATRAALARQAETIAFLRHHFPGKITLERVPGVVHPAGDHGPVLDLVVKLGAAGVPVITAGLASASADTRYYALLCARALDGADARAFLIDALCDADVGVRAAAVDALHAVPHDELEDDLARARRALLEDDVARAQRTAQALAELGDSAAIPMLLELHGRGGALAKAATAALVRLSKQDFAESNKKWRQWWDRNRTRHPIEWMLEGLAHKEPEIRRIAIDDLRALTGEYFGYHHDLGKREREAARQRWVLWWGETGRRRFLRSGTGAAGRSDERHRPTALLPIRRD